jgi:hypothetical protein
VRDDFEGMMIFHSTMVEKRSRRFKVGKKKTFIPVQLSTISNIDIFVILTSGMVIVGVVKGGGGNRKGYDDVAFVLVDEVSLEVASRLLEVRWRQQFCYGVCVRTVR